MTVNFIIKGFTTDIITNSSSELFTGINHTIEAVTEIVTTIFEWYNDADPETLEWEKEPVHMDDCLVIKPLTDRELRTLASYNIRRPKYPDTGYWRGEEYIKVSNADELMEKYYDECEKHTNDYIEVSKKTLKGTVVIEGLSDNSIPWDIVYKIETVFNCERTHLG